MPYSGTYYPSYGRTQSAMSGLSQTIQGLGQNIALEKEREQTHELAMKGLDIKRSGLEADQKMGLLNLEAEAKKAEGLRADKEYERGLDATREKRAVAKEARDITTSGLQDTRLNQQISAEARRAQPISLRNMFVKESGVPEEQFDNYIQYMKEEQLKYFGYNDTQIASLFNRQKANPDEVIPELASTAKFDVLFNGEFPREKQQALFHDILIKKGESDPRIKQILDSNKAEKEYESDMAKIKTIDRDLTYIEKIKNNPTSVLTPQLMKAAGMEFSDPNNPAVDEYADELKRQKQYYTNKINEYDTKKEYENKISIMNSLPLDLKTRLGYAKDDAKEGSIARDDETGQAFIWNNGQWLPK